MKMILLLLGVIGVLLGGLWLLQGLGIVNIPPILCVADCTPIEGGSLTWTIVGLVVAAGTLALVYSRKRR